MKATDLLYKAKGIHSLEWVKGYYSEKTMAYGSYAEILVPGNHTDETDDKPVHVNRKTLCIGFRDENGKCWFAGDSVAFIGLKTKGVIVFSLDGFSVRLTNGRTVALSHAMKDIEITGNIHD